MIEEGESRKTGRLKGKPLHAAIKIKTTLEVRNPPMPLHEVAASKVRLTAQVLNKTHNVGTIGIPDSGATDSKAAPDKDETVSKVVPGNGAMANINKATRVNDATGNNKAVPDKDVTTGNRVVPDNGVTVNNSVGKVNRAHIKRIAVIVTVTDNHLYTANARISTGMAHNDKTITSAGTALNKVTDNNGMEQHLVRLGKDAKASRATTRDVMVNRASGAMDNKATTSDAMDNKAITNGATDNKATINAVTDNKATTSGVTGNKVIISAEMGNSRVIISDATGNKATSSVQTGKPEQATTSKELVKGADPKLGLTSVEKAVRVVSRRKTIKDPAAVSLAVVQNHPMVKKMTKNPTNLLKTIGSNNFKKLNKPG